MNVKNYLLILIFSTNISATMSVLDMNVGYTTSDSCRMNAKKHALIIKKFKTIYKRAQKLDAYLEKMENKFLSLDSAIKKTHRYKRL